MENSKIKIWKKDNTQLILLLLFCLVVVYYAPYIITQIVFVILLIFFYRSRKDYLWLAFFLILFNAPGRLFQSSYPGDTQTIPYFSLIQGASLAFDELLIAVSILKVNKQRLKNIKFIYRQEFKFLLIFAGFVLIYSFPMGIGGKNLIRAFRVTFPWFLVLVIPKLLRDEKDLLNFNRLVFPIVFIALASQIYSYTTGEYFVDYFNRGGQSVDSRLLEVTANSDSAARSMSSMITLFYVFVQSLFFFFSANASFSRRYLTLVILTSFISVYLTATRGWIIAFTAILGLSIISFVKPETMKRVWKAALLGVVVAFLLLTIFPRVKLQIKNTSARLNTMQMMMEGDMSAGGTLLRVVERGPRVMSKFNDSKIIGWGFSDTYFEYVDPHVGHHSLLLNVGILGYIILNILFFLLVYKVFVISNRPAVRYVYDRYLRIFAIGLIGIYIIHSTSVQLWGLQIKYILGLLYALVFTSINIFYFNAVDVYDKHQKMTLLNSKNGQKL